MTPGWSNASASFTRFYRTLELDGCARIDFRVAADGTPYFLEANPNPAGSRTRFL
jgi:D-alanine-D-alanine ligase-like ATP-grasp enzyme